MCFLQRGIGWGGGGGGERGGHLRGGETRRLDYNENVMYRWHLEHWTEIAIFAILPP